MHCMSSPELAIFCGKTREKSWVEIFNYTVMVLRCFEHSLLHGSFSAYLSSHVRTLWNMIAPIIFICGTMRCVDILRATHTHMAKGPMRRYIATIVLIVFTLVWFMCGKYCFLYMPLTLGMHEYMYIYIIHDY